MRKKLTLLLTLLQGSLLAQNPWENPSLIDIGKEKAKSVPTLNRKFSHHVYGVNSVCWHPFKSLILSSSLDISDSIKLWDPYS